MDVTVLAQAVLLIILTVQKIVTQAALQALLMHLGIFAMPVAHQRHLNIIITIFVIVLVQVVVLIMQTAQKTVTPPALQAILIY